jgi:hypothetical protein
MVLVKRFVRNKWQRCRQVFGSFKTKHCQLRKYTLNTKPASSIVVSIEYGTSSFPADTVTIYASHKLKQVWTTRN